METLLCTVLLALLQDIGKLLYIVWKTLRNVSNDYFAKELPQIRTQLWFNQNIRSNLGHIVNNGQQFAVLHASVMPFLGKVLLIVLTL